MEHSEKTPKQIVAELDNHVIGQDQAKKAISIALRNRYRRMQLPEDMQEEITPKNLMMIGPTGVGKTEIARRLAKIVDAPFIKVEATKFTEVGYVGRDVESMVRDLVEVAYKMEQDELFKKVRSVKRERSSVAEKLQRGLLENEEVTIQMEDPAQKFQGADGMLGQMGLDLSDTLGSLAPKRMVTRTMPVKEAREVFVREESEKLMNTADAANAAIKRAENTGIIFIDEIDKITSKSQQNAGEVSREGVQRDILPIVEGSQIKTKYGIIKTDHILFITSGAFAQSKPSDLIAELQGRFPIRVELEDLSKDDFVKILTEPNNALIKQYIAIIGTDNIKVTFTIEAIEKIAEIAYRVNHETDNIGARRLHTILEKLLEDLLFEGPDMQMGEITITEAYVEEKVGKIVADKDLSQYIL